jgi:hypothetical protein
MGRSPQKVTTPIEHRLVGAHLMLKDSQASLNNDVLQDGSRRNVDSAVLSSHNDDGALEDNAATKVHISSDSEMVKLNQVGNAANSLLELSNLLEVTTELDERSRSKPRRVYDELTVAERVEVGLDEHEVGASLDWQETFSWDIDTVCVLEEADGGTDGCLKLQNGEVGLTLLVGWDRLLVGNDLEFESVILNDSLDSLQVHPDVVGVEVLELLDGLEFVDVLLWHLSDLKKSCLAFVVNDCTTLHVSLGLVCQFHDIFSLGLDHVLQNAQINDGAQVIGIRHEDVLNASFYKLVEHARVVERLKNVTMSWWVPIRQLRLEGLGSREEGVLEDSGISRLVEGQDVDVVAFVLLDDGGSVFVGVERVHEDEWDVDVVGPVKVLNLSD